MKKRTPDNPGNDHGGALQAGRAHYARHDWSAAFEALASADAQAALDRHDLELLAWCGALTDRDDVMFACLERIYIASTERGDCQRAARAAFWTGFRLFALNEMARAGGWLARAERQLELDGRECAETGYLLLPKAAGLLGAGDFAGAESIARNAVELGERYADADLAAFARHMQGRALMRRGRVGDGLRLLDDAMLAATSGELSPMMTGLVYCSVIASCQQVFAWEHAREWTAVLTAWCADEPQLAAFTRTCQAHRAEVLQLGGDWPGALEQAERACQARQPETDPEAVGDAQYQQAEIHRLRGQWDAAEAAYLEANRYGREPQPGLALLRLAQGRPDDAAGAIGRVLETTSMPWQRARYLPAVVEIALAAGALERADAAAGELRSIAARFDTEVLSAMAGHAEGAVSLARGDARSAIRPLQAAFRVWHKVGAPYIAARIRVLTARACEALGDGEGARLERDAARQVFERLGAAPDLAALDGARTAEERGGLSAREIRVLQLVAGGMSNKVIANELHLSVRTIDRHMSNIFTKLDVASRTEAAAFAIRHGLV